MKVFVTGASGGIGSLLVPELLANGHEVLGLARSDASAKKITDSGAGVLRGDVTDPETLRTGAAEADAVVHVAFNHSPDLSRSVADEARAIETFGAALEGTGKALLIASGTPIVPGRLATEEDPSVDTGPLAATPLGRRGRTAQYTLDLAGKGVRSVVVRLPRSVHYRGHRYGFASSLIAAARRTGVSGYVGDGTQRWPAVHHLDAVRLFRLALEQAGPGTVVHAVANEGDPMRSLATVIGEQLGVPVESVPAEQFGPVGAVYAIDQPASSELTREKFGWQPTHPSLLDDLAAGNYPE
ncbi:nucleoside-diphosphate-sugar epimerase [Amycolatopsis bartoniae]|uniref:3-beta hydroxysteroid dehydrogenase n=1 Tax=Amycolatopsis bartoniae TaxID=941986 RepID=A0A8H9J3P6_9PSEU|nr:SDR family oxidoreductase [Amycolatopsis bartoniae]MBB2938554.1 nucleoside-diphosphate-sugar epimerase [Amycolatopsis bartoniae]TVT10307.1 SDR family oxidoreductase [Amycolatopsis bartoniae]GHF70186.1 3-beta hydroxysteroid dehydrogenase [Amycolatopsis bartoniae]